MLNETDTTLAVLPPLLLHGRLDYGTPGLHTGGKHCLRGPENKQKQNQAPSQERTGVNTASGIRGLGFEGALVFQVSTGVGRHFSSAVDRCFGMGLVWGRLYTAPALYTASAVHRHGKGPERYVAVGSAVQRPVTRPVFGCSRLATRIPMPSALLAQKKPSSFEKHAYLKSLSACYITQSPEQPEKKTHLPHPRPCTRPLFTQTTTRGTA